MATETLRLDIVANNKDAVAALKQTDSELRKVSSTALKTGTDVAKGSNQAAFALTNLGRIAQDAPFGFIGIQNNLNPMLESFQRLQKETGSAGSALKAMASSLIGPAGLGLALSVGGAALLMFGDRLFKTDNAAKQAAESMGKLRDSAAKELVQFKKLTIVAADANIPLVQRKQAVEDLQKNYPAYLGNLSQEDILAGKLGGAYEKVTNALRAKIALQAAEEKVIPIIKEQLKVAEDLANEQKKIAALSGITAEDFKQAEKFAKATGKINPFIGLQAEAIAASQKIPELQKAYNAFENQIQKLFGTMKPFIEASNGLNEKYDEQKNKVTELKDEVANYIKELLYLRTIQKQGMRDVSARPVLAGDYSNPEVNISQDMVARTLATQQATKTQLDYANALRLTALEEEKIAMWAGIANNAFMAFQSSLIAGNSVVDSLGEAFKRLAIQIGVSLAKTAALAGIISLLSGGKINFGSAFKLASKYTGALPFAREGGVFSGPSSGYPAILHGTEAVLNPKQFKNLTSNMMNVGAMRGMGQMQPANGQVVLRGQDLVLALDRAGVNLNLRRG
jgi:hypothetical protein